MSTTPVNAYAAMAQNLLKIQQGGESAPQEGQTSNFLSFLETQKDQWVTNLQQGEVESLKAIAGQGDVNNLVTALAEGHLTLKAILSIRDKVLQTIHELRSMQV